MGIVLQGIENGSAIGSTFQVGVTSDGKLMVNAAVTVGSITASTGSQAYMWGKSGTNYIELAVDAAGQLRTAGTVTATTGSQAFLWAKSGTFYGELAMASGTANILRVQNDVWTGIGSVLVTGSVNVATPIAWTGVGSTLVNGSVNVTNAIGSVAVTSLPAWSGIGSVLVNGSVNVTNMIGSVAVTSSQLWAGVGSVVVTGSVNVAAPIAWTGIGSVLVNGSVNVTNLVGSVAVTSNTLWTGVGSVLVNGSVNVTNAIGSMAVTNTVATSGTSKLYGLSGTDWYPLLSTSGTAGGVLRIDGSISATTGSQAYLWAKSGTFYGELGMLSGTTNILRVNPDVWTGIGSTLVTGSVNITNMIGSVAVTSNPLWTGIGSVLISSQPAWTGIGSVLTTGSVNVANMVGSVAVTSNTLWTGGGAVLVNGSVNVTNMIGSVAVTSSQLWAGIGSVLVTGSVNVSAPIAWTGIGSVQLAGGSITNMPAMTKAVAKTLFNGAINISSGTNVAVVAAQAGSDIYVYGYKVVFSAACSANFTGYSALEGAQSYAANGGVVEMTEPPYYLFKTASVGSAIGMSLTAGSAGGRINYWFG